MEFSRYPKIRRLHDLFIGEQAPGYDDLVGMLDDPNDDIVIQEKIDGANFRFMVTKDGLVFGSRRRELGDGGNAKHGAKGFTNAINYVKDIFSKLNKYELKLYEGMIFFLEGCWKHSTPYDWDRMPTVIGYDIKQSNAEVHEWMEYPLNKSIFEELGFTFVPVLRECKVLDIKPFKEEDIPTSEYGHFQAEGVMIKNYKKGLFAKFVTQKHREVARGIFGGKTPKIINPEDLLHRIISEPYIMDNISENEYKFIRKRLMARDGTQDLVDSYCTNARIDKIIFKLLDDGEKLGMVLMQHLPKAVLEDIFDEGFGELYKSRLACIFDFGKYKKLVASRCASVLKQVIDNSVRFDD